MSPAQLAGTGSCHVQGMYSASYAKTDPTQRCNNPGTILFGEQTATDDNFGSSEPI